LNLASLGKWGARVVHERRRGLNVARNRGVREARGSIVAFVDDDCTVDPGWLAGFRRAFEDPDVGFATGRTEPLSLARRTEQCFEQLFTFDRGEDPRSFDRGTPGAWFQVSPAEVGSGCNMAFRRAVLDGVGGFDEALDMGTAIGGGGDLDMFGRLLRGGAHARYAPDAHAWHQHRGTVAELGRQVWGYGVAQGALAWKVWWSAPALRPAVWSFWRHRAGGAARRMVVTIRARQVLLPYLSLMELAGLVMGPVAYPVSSRTRRAAPTPRAPQSIV
jgi:GT2 family glycosyltransferase